MAPEFLSLGELENIYGIGLSLCAADLTLGRSIKG
jgi:hypothetical protein